MRSLLRPLDCVLFLPLVLPLGCRGINALKQRCLSGETAACESACDKGVAGEGGCFQAGNAHRERGALDYTSSDFTKARSYFKKACSGGYGEGCLFAAQTIDAPYGPLEPSAAPAPAEPKTITDDEIAEREDLLVRACDLAPAASCKRLGDVLIGKNSERAETAYHRACASSRDAEACKGARTKQVQQLEQWRAGCTRRTADDCTRLGDALYAVDAPRAVRLFVAECKLRGVDAIAGGVGSFVAERARAASTPFAVQSRSTRPGADGPRVSALVPDVHGGVAVITIQHVIQMHVDALSACAASPSTHGKIVAEAVVDVTGDVWRATAKESSLSSEETRCFLSALENLGFGGALSAPATVVMPIVVGAEADIGRRL